MVLMPRLIIAIVSAVLFSQPLTTSAYAAPAPARISELNELGPAELEKLYAGGRVPRLDQMEGRLKGRGLFPQEEDAFCSPCGAALRAFMGTPLILWAGKIFTRDEDGNWEGRNLFLSAAYGHAAYRMRPLLLYSPLSGREVLRLDYQVGRNPPIINRVFDEVVELRPGLWLGKAYYRENGGGIRKLMWFALERL